MFVTVPRSRAVSLRTCPPWCHSTLHGIYFLKYTLCDDLWSAPSCLFFSFFDRESGKRDTYIKILKKKVWELYVCFNEPSVHLCEQSILFMKNEV